MKDMRMTLTEPERKLLALALQGFAMRSGPGFFPAVQQVAAKLEITDLLEMYLRGWIAYAKEKQK